MRFAWLMTLALGVIAPVRIDGQQVPDLVMQARELAMHEFVAFVLQHGNQPLLSGGTDVVVDELSTALGVRLVRARVNAIGHFPPYLLVLTDDRVLRAGGFRDTDLGAIAALLRPTAGCRTDQHVVEFATALSTIADSEGAFRTIVPMNPGEDALDSLVVAAWQRERDTSWPRDTVLTFTDSRVARLTSLSWMERSGNVSWLPALHSFVMDGSCNLLAWSRRLGDVFQAPEGAPYLRKLRVRR